MEDYTIIWFLKALAFAATPITAAMTIHSAYRTSSRSLRSIALLGTALSAMAAWFLLPL